MEEVGGYLKYDTKHYVLTLVRAHRNRALGVVGLAS